MNRDPISMAGSVAQLARSERGVRVLRHLHDLLDGPGASLDTQNQRAVLNILERSFDGRLWEALDLIGETIHPEGTPQ